MVATHHGQYRNTENFGSQGAIAVTKGHDPQKLQFNDPQKLQLDCRRECYRSAWIIPTTIGEI
ncbi:hypothetical protein ACN4EG_15770 [Alkalinema pantanalense CENA528]|uniref:hypothetical protein n=1 Tax=Alkalinema pantanalense TaxID=1620705 RepID=UPI003D6F7E62